MAAGNFLACLPVILGNEGGKANNPADPGGKTDKGVTQATYDKWRASKGLSKRDVFLISDGEVQEIYQEGYWTDAGCDVLPAGLDLTHFDATVTSGLGHSKGWLAKARQDAGADTSGSIHAYAAARLTSFKSFRAWATFGKGWSARIASVEAKSIAMALGSAAPAVIAKAGAAAAKKAKVAGTVATTVGTGGTIIATVEAVHAHPMVGGAVALASLVSWVWSKFHASTAGARAAALAVHAAG